MQHKMPVITEEKRHALIAKCKAAIKSLAPIQGEAEILGKECFEIALASLEAQPIYQVEKDNYKNHPPSDAGDWVSWVDCDLATAREGDYYGVLVRTLYPLPPVQVMPTIVLPKLCLSATTRGEREEMQDVRDEDIAAIKAAGFNVEVEK